MSLAADAARELAAPQAALDALYARSPDPWAFRTSAYEQDKYDATIAALQKDRYRAILELGCGNGELAKRLAVRCERYVGLDAVQRALDEARQAVPYGTFVQAFLPAPLPDGPFDLVVLSEILYFLDRDGIGALAQACLALGGSPEIIAVNFRPAAPTSLTGDSAIAAFASAVAPPYQRALVVMNAHFRIDRLTA